MSVIPATPVAVRRRLTAVMPNDAVGKAVHTRIAAFLGAVGEIVWVRAGNAGLEQLAAVARALVDCRQFYPRQLAVTNES